MSVPEYIHHSGWPWPLDAVQDFFESMWSLITSLPEIVAGWVWSIMPEGLKNFIDLVYDLTQTLWKKILDFFEDPLGSIKAGFDWVISGLTDVIGWWDPEQGRFVGGFLGWLWDAIDYVAGAASDAASWLYSNLTGVLSTLSTAIEGFVGTIHDAMSGALGWIADTLWGWVDGALRWASDSFKWLAGEVTAGVEWVASSVGTMFDGAVSVIGDALTSLFTEPLAAIGGFFTQFLTGFGIIDVAGHSAGITTIFDGMTSSYQALLAAHSPLTPEEAATATSTWKKEQRDYWYQLYISALLIEGLSLGQVETPNMMLLTEPQGRASLDLAKKWYAAPYEVGYSVLLEQYWNSVYTPQIPPVPDLIRFVVREVITPERFADVIPYMGFSKEWADAYWEAHWILPSTGNLYDAFHRKVITREELDKYIVWHDFKPDPRPDISKSDQEIMRSIIKRMIPRVDLRFAWEMGLLTDAQLDERYEWLGYEDDAPLMADIQKARALVEEMHKVRDEWIRFFIEGFILEDTLRANLDAIGIGPARIEYYVAYGKKRREREHKADLLRIYEDGYIKELITDEDLSTRVGEILIDEEARTLFLERAYIRKYRKPRAA